MPIDTSIYQNIQPVKPVETPSFMDTAQKAMSLSGLAMQQQQARLGMQQQMAMRQAYAQNVDPNSGELNQHGVLSDLNRMGYAHLTPQVNEELAKSNKAAAEAHVAKMQDLHQTVSAGLPYLQYALSLPDDTAKEVWPKLYQQMKDQGLTTPNMLPDWDRDHVAQAHYMGNHYKEALENQLTQTHIGKGQAEIGKIESEIGQVGDKYLQAFKEDLDPNKARGGNLAKSQSVINAADRLGAMFKQFPDYNIPKAQQTEMVSAFGSLLNGGSAPFVSQLEELVPKSARGDANALASWVFNDPMGADQQKFMKLLHESVQREREVAENQVKTAQVQRISSHQQLFKTNPQAAMTVLHSYGIEPENVKDGKYVPSEQKDNPGKSDLAGGKSSDLITSANAGQKAPGISAKDAQALQWLKSADPSDPVAFKVRSKLKAKGLVK